MKKFHITDYMLDLYSLDALSPRKRKIVETALTTDEELKMKYEAREKLKQDLYDRYKSRHPDDVILQVQDENVSDLKIKTYPRKRNILRLGVAAAAVVAITLTLIFTVNYFKNHSINDNNIYMTQENKENESDEIKNNKEQSNSINDEHDNRTEIASIQRNEYGDIPIKNNNENIIPTTERNTTANDDDSEFEMVRVSYDILEYYNPWKIIDNQRVFVIPEEMTYISENRYKNNEIINIIISNGVIRIAESAFENNKIDNVILPASVEIIGDNAFSGNPLLSITIGDNVTLSTSSLPGDFSSAYTRYSRTGGTYTRSSTSSNNWVKQ